MPTPLLMPGGYHHCMHSDTLPCVSERANIERRRGCCRSMIYNAAGQSRSPSSPNRMPPAGRTKQRVYRQLAACLCGYESCDAATSFTLFTAGRRQTFGRWRDLGQCPGVKRRCALVSEIAPIVHVQPREQGTSLNLSSNLNNKPGYARLAVPKGHTA